jgi:hypothetical protein
MRRVLFGLAVVTLTVVALAGPASAAPGQVTQFRFSGAFADAGWSLSSGTSSASAGITVSTSKQGSGLFVDELTATLDANGNVTGGTDITVDVTSGFSLTIDQPGLASASVSGSGLPATACTLDANFNPISCSATTIDVNASWTGQGPIGRSVSNEHFKSGGFSFTEHVNGTSRAATAAGTIGGITFSPADLQFANLGTTKAGSTSVCIGNSC